MMSRYDCLAFRRVLRFAFCLAAFAISCSPVKVATAGPIEVRFSPEVRAEPYTGRVYVFFANRGEPRSGPNWFNPEPFIARDVVNLKPGETVVFDPEKPDDVLSFPVPLGEQRFSGYAQALIRFNPLSPQVGNGAGNGFSERKRVPLPNEILQLDVTSLVPPREFLETERVKLLEIRSKLLSDFHGRDVTIRGGIVLPESYATSSDRRYPVLFSIPGFGGTHHVAERAGRSLREDNAGGVEFLRVMLDPRCPLGHHVFANSANNGPWGDALVEEFIPALDKQYRTVAEPAARFLTGHSSGGWSSLWLQVTYPDHFGGTWSTAPDPVDFRDFQRINIYQPKTSIRFDENGAVRPLARRGNEVVVWYRNFDRMEHVLGYGGQLHSFEAVFSPRGADGKPQLLWSRETGEIDSAVAKTWEAYDIRLILERNWKTLGPKLAGKLHVFTGSLDTFYLEGAVRLLKESLEELGSDAVVEIHEGRDHSNLMTRKLRDRMRAEMVEAFNSRQSRLAIPRGQAR